MCLIFVSLCAWDQTSFRTVVKCSFSAADPSSTLCLLSCRREERCELHRVRCSQLEPLIITPLYHLQQPCTDAKTLRGLATLPYLIWARSTETVLYHQPIQSQATAAPRPRARLQSEPEIVWVTWPGYLASFINNCFLFSKQRCFLLLPPCLSQALSF